MKKIILLLIVVLLANCDKKSEVFNASVKEGPTPWNKSIFDDSNEKFTFAIFTDLNGGERDKVFEIAASQLALLRPEFILSVGDLINGDTQDHKVLLEEWDSFDERASKTLAPIFYVGGNHDLTNKTMHDLWASRYGPQYYYFVYKNILFLVLNTEDYPEKKSEELWKARSEYKLAIKNGEMARASDMPYKKMQERITGDIDKDQSTYFVEAIRNNPDVTWTMIFMHKPVWLKEVEPEFLAIEEALSDRPYTVFNGHLHNYSHQVRKDRDYIMLGTTGGAQHPKRQMSFDHVTMVTIDKGQPSIVNLRMDGILDKTGHIPLDGESICFQVSTCKNNE